MEKKAEKQRIRRGFLRILGIFCSIWIFWGAESWGAGMTEAELQAPEEQQPDGEELKDISLPEGAEPEDSLPPEAEITWRDEKGNMAAEYYVSSGELIGELLIREEHLDQEHTVFYLEASGAAGQELPCREAELINGRNWNELWEMAEKEELEEVSLEREEAKGLYRMRLHLKTEAEYVFSAEIADEAGNRVLGGEGAGESPVVLGSFCLDRTPPEIRQGEGPEGQPAGDITWNAEQQTFLKN